MTKMQVASCQLPVASKSNARSFSSTGNSQLATSNYPKGFTVIELLIVIGIITLLATFLFYAYNHIVTDTRARDTKTAMQTCEALLSNYQQSTNFARPLPILYAVTPAGTNVNPFGAVTGNTNGASVPTPGNAAANAMTSTFWTGGYTGSGEPASTVVSGDTLRGGKGFTQQVIDTVCVMYCLQSIPENAVILNNVPTQKKISVQVNLVPTPGSNVSPVNVTLLLDGWNNPILFVPSDGLYSVMTSADPTYNAATPYSLGNQVVYPISAPPQPYFTYTCINTTGVSGTAPTNPPPNTINMPDTNWGGLCDPSQLRPFWVSGGPDGDISNTRGDPTGSATGTHDDDNIYSFNN